MSSINDPFNRLTAFSIPIDLEIKPYIFDLSSEGNDEEFARLVDSGQVREVRDGIREQLRELIKGRHPSKQLTDDEYEHLINGHLNGCPIQRYGVWVFYPWSGRLIHLLGEAEFAEVRTSRNRYKITDDEQALLKNKRIGVIGLSVGQSVALTLAMERGFGELRLADFDVLELSNMNRIRTGVHGLGIYKVVNTAREIAEIDPFLKVTLFTEGITTENMDRFFSDGGALDVLVEECDSLDVKITARLKARSLGIPVVMDTSDRGLIDVERFDLEPDRPIFHGLIGDVGPEGLSGLTNEEKIPLIRRMVNMDAASERLKYSMGEVRKTITTWPQLASGVVMGGAIAADVTRRILLGSYTESGRYYVDPEQQIADGSPVLHKQPYNTVSQS